MDRDAVFKITVKAFGKSPAAFMMSLSLLAPGEVERVIDATLAL